MLRAVTVDHELHQYTTVEIPFEGGVLQMLLESGSLAVTFDGRYIHASANRLGWECAARWLCQSDDFKTRQLGTVLISTFPKLFINLDRSLKPDGTLACL